MIGIVGGMGPYAGVQLHKAIHDMTDATDDQGHYPVIHIDFARDIPDRTAFLLGEGAPNPSDAIIRQIDVLLRAVATVIGIPCNTTHAPAIFEPVQEHMARHGAGRVLVNMLEEVLSHLSEEKTSAAGLLATMGTYRAGFYRIYGEKHGIEIVYPEKAMEQLCHDCIYDREEGIKKLGRLSPACREKYDRILDCYRTMGINTVILGCTEISMVFPGVYREMHMTRTIDILAKALIREEKRLPAG